MGIDIREFRAIIDTDEESNGLSGKVQTVQDMSKAHDNQNKVVFTFIGNIADYPTTMYEQDNLVLSQQVIKELEGKEYSEWRYAREGIWKAIYKHHGENFNLPTKQQAKGRAFFAKKSGHVVGINGERRRVEIHHKTHCADNFDKYSELSNYIILFPKTHDAVHYLDRQEI